MFHFRVRNGTGWGHQAMTTRLQEVFHLLLALLSFAAWVCVLLLGGFPSYGHADIRMAWCCVEQSLKNLALSKLVTGGDAVIVYEVNWMLVVLG